MRADDRLLTASRTLTQVARSLQDLADRLATQLEALPDAQTGGGEELVGKGPNEPVQDETHR